MFDLTNDRTIRFFALMLLLVGLLSRVLPLFMGEQRVFGQYPTEDGYLMLTIARYMALGFGMSTADGTLLTNGTQPFVTFIWTIGYILFDGDKLWGVIFAHVVQVAISVLFAWVFYKLLRKVFSDISKELCLMFTAVVYASPHLIPHSMNFLETGTYLLFVTVVIYLFYEQDNKKYNWGVGKCIGIGCTLGVMFWVRIDSVFIILAACLTHLYYGLGLGAQVFLQRFKSTLIFGSISVAISTPWLVYNYLYFGSLLPISGQAQNASALAQNAVAVPSAVLEYLLVFLPIPSALQETTPVIVFSLLILSVAIVIGVIFYKNSQQKHKGLLFMGAITVFCFVLYYGVFFGAKHFIPRYFIVLAPFLALLQIAIILRIVAVFQAKSIAKAIYVIAGVIVALLIVGLNVRIFKTRIPHEHMHVVNWVKENVSEDRWVGAIQTGTLGYFHDKTLNLDGKVNPKALRAKQGKEYCLKELGAVGGKNCLIPYIIQSEIDYLADWYGIASWNDIYPLSEYFELVVNDSRRNLAVFQRYRTVE